MSEIAGRMSVIVGGHFLAKPHGGKGVLLGGVPGVLPGKVVVLGGGTSGVNAARMATGLGADVTILEVDVERMRFLDITMSHPHALFERGASRELLPTVDLLIGAVLVPGREGAEAHLARDAALDETGQRLRRHRHRPGRLRGDLAPHHARRARFRRGGRAPLLRHEHARRLRPHRDAGADQRDLSLHRGARRTRPRRGVPESSTGLATASMSFDGKLTCQAVAEAHGLPYVAFGHVPLHASRPGPEFKVRRS
jgi:alanine dehydrogenase